MVVWHYNLFNIFMSSHEEQFGTWLDQVKVAPDRPGEGKRMPESADRKPARAGIGPKVGELCRAWGDPTDQYNSSAEIAREFGWLDAEGRLTQIGADELAAMDAAQRKHIADTAIKLKPRRDMPVETYNPKNEIEALLAKHGYDGEFRFIKIGNDGLYQFLFVTKGKKGSARYVPGEDFIGTPEEIADWLEDHLK